MKLYEENTGTVPKDAREGLKNTERHAIFLSRTQHHKDLASPYVRLYAESNPSAMSMAVYLALNKLILKFKRKREQEKSFEKK